MKNIRRIFALALVLVLVFSFAFTLSLSAFPGHGAKHVCPEADCMVCAVVIFAQNLFRAVSAAAVVLGLFILLQKRRFLPFFKKLPVKQKNETPVSLKNKITG